MEKFRTQKNQNVKCGMSVEELILYLSQPVLVEGEGKRRSRADAQLAYISGSGGSTLSSTQYIFDAPLGPIDADELSWYLERFIKWPGEAFRDRARAVEGKLPVWGQELYAEALGREEAMTVRQAWEKGDGKHQRCFTVHMEELPGADPKKMEAAAHLLSLPWELLHHGEGFLFQDQPPVQVRRQLASRRRKSSLVTKPPLRVLLLSPRPEDAGYIDHRIAAIPLAESLAALGELAELTILAEPTLDGLIEALYQADENNAPFHVIHFDGHGVFLQERGEGALCFEQSGQSHELFGGQTDRVTASELAQALISVNIRPSPYIGLFG